MVFLMFQINKNNNFDMIILYKMLNSKFDFDYNNV